MTQIPSIAGSSASTKPFGENNTLNDLNLDVFLKLLISELQNQDPLNPMDNSEMLNQINQIREIGATDKLTNTLDSVLLGQNITSSTNLIGKDVKALSDDNQNVSGTVTRVSIEEGKPKLHLDLNLKAESSIETGELGKGKYGYRVVWRNENGNLEGIELSGKDAVTTSGNAQSIQLRNLPITATAKQIYRTDSSGEGDYRLLGQLADGSQSSFLDKVADTSRSETRQTEPFDKDSRFRIRSYKISLNNVSEVVNG